MTQRRLFVLVLVVALAVAATTGVATGAASPDTPCQGTEGTEAKAFLDTDQSVEGDRRYYPGTTVTMYLCQDGEKLEYPTVWGFNADEVPGISMVAEREYSVVFTLEGGVTSVTPTSEITKQDGVDIPSLTIAVQTGYRDQSSITGETLRFPDEGSRDEFRQAESDWEQSTGRIRNASSALSNVSSAETNSSTVREAIATLNGSALPERTTELQRSVLPAARAGDGPAAATVVTEANRTAADVRTNARASLEAYLGTVRERRRSAVRSVRLFAGGGLVGGLLVGAVAGYALSRRTLRKIERDRGVSTATQYSPKQVALPLALGVVALLAGLAFGALNWPTLFEVIL